MKIKSLIVGAAFCALVPFAVSAQNTNLIKNGDFEGECKGKLSCTPEGWYADGAATMKVEGKRPGSTGQFMLEAYANYRNFRLAYPNVEEYHKRGAVNIEKGATYVLTIWHKTNVDRTLKSFITISGYKTSPVGEDEETLHSIYMNIESTTEWKEDKFEITLPQDLPIEKLGLDIQLPYASGSARIFLDDISLVKSTVTNIASATAPKTQTIKVYNVEGQYLLTTDKTDYQKLGLPRGVYVALSQGKSTKFIIK